MNVKAKCLISINVAQSTTVHELLAIIQQQTYISISELRLLYATKELHNNTTLSEYHIQPGAILCLKMRVLGGMKVNNNIIFNIKYSLINNRKITRTLQQLINQLLKLQFFQIS